MPSLSYSEELDRELDALSESHEDDVALIDALMEELSNDPLTLSSLTSGTPKWLSLYEPPFEIKRFASCWDSGRRVYLLKLYDTDGHLSDFRVFIGHDIQTDDYFVLSVQPRQTSYDTNSQAFRDLCDRYDRLRIPPIGGHG